MQINSWLVSPALILSCSALAATAREISPITATSLLQAGRHMLPIDVHVWTNALLGKAPQEPGRYRILSGSTVLWEGGEGQEFKLAIPAGTQKLYLLSLSNRNQNWQDLRLSASNEAQPTQPPSLPILKPSTADAGPALRQLLESYRGSDKPQVLKIPHGTYHFYPEGAQQMSFYTSNHDQVDFHFVGVPLVDLRHFTLDGQGSTFIFHGKMTPFLLMDSKGISIKNINIATATPFSSEGHIVSHKNGKTTVRMGQKEGWQVKNNRLYNKGKDWEYRVEVIAAFKKDGRMAPLGNKGDVAWGHAAKQVGENLVEFAGSCEQLGLVAGDVLVLRSYARPHPAMVIYRSERVRLDEVIFHDAQGMALLAQRSRDIRISGGGCIRAKGRWHTTQADATHFSNTRGLIMVEGAHYESMMDDAINVHSTCLGITKVESPTQIIANYMHPQAVGFEVFLPGEAVQFIHGPTLENEKSSLGRIKHAEKLNEHQLRLTLEKPLPEGIGVGDAIENADWYPRVNFSRNTIRWNRARGSLFTTPAPVLVKDNKFIWGSGSAILLAGDAQGWYESGRCTDVTIMGNLFEQNLTSSYQFTEGIISIYPEVKRPEEQKERYHQKIHITGNRFITHAVPLLFAISADRIFFRDNKIIRNELFEGKHGGKDFVLRHCGENLILEAPQEIKKKKIKREKSALRG